MSKPTFLNAVRAIAAALLLGIAAGPFAVAVAQTVPAEPPSDSGFRVLQGPGGKQLVEVPMPQDFEPIRLVGLHGLPVAGPVVQGGEPLDPYQWEQLGADPGDIDTGFMRITQALRLASEPRLLQDIDWAESFALKNLDEQAVAKFFPPGYESESNGTFGSNEFERKQRFQDFLGQYIGPLGQSLPTVPFEFLYVEEVILQAYDQARKAFPVSTPGGDSGATTLHALGLYKYRLEMPADLSMEPAQAEALLARLPDGSTVSVSPIRRVHRAMRLVLTGFTVAPNGRVSVEIEPRAIALYEDPLLTRLIHEYPVKKKKADEGPRMASIFGRPLLPHLPVLYAMRDIEGYLSEETLLAMAEDLLAMEQNELERYANTPGAQTCANKTTIFEWATARTELANGPLLDVLMYPDADWSFLDRETKLGLVPQHCVEVFLFPQDELRDRELGFVLQEMAPVYRRSLEAAMATLPETVYLNIKLSAAKYDHERKALVFEKDDDRGYVESQDGDIHLLSRPRRVAYLAAGTPQSESGSRSIVRVPKSLEGLAIYRLFQVLGKNESPFPPSFQPREVHGSHGHGHWWRRGVRFGLPGNSPDTIAIDRLLDYPEIPLDPPAAEQLIQSVGDGINDLRAIVMLDIERARRVAPGDEPILVASLRRVVIITPEGRELAVREAESFPDARATYRAAQEQEQRATAAAEQAAATQEAAEQARKEAADALITEKFAYCEGRPTARNSLECYEKLCDWLGTSAKLQGAELAIAKHQCVKKERYARRAIDNEQRRASSKVRAWRRECKGRARFRWRLTENSPEYARTVEACAVQTERSTYGPDILGLRLAMDYNDANLIRMRELDIRSGHARQAESSLFDKGTIFFSDDRSHLLAMYLLENPGGLLPAVIGRRIFFEGEGQPVASLLKPMVGKYGSPVWRDNRHILWAFTPDGKAKSGESLERCGRLATMLTDSRWGGMKRDEEISRIAPPAISERASPADYAAFADCGVVLIAKLGWLPNGAIGDVSLVMFDPGWIAEQPEIAFADAAEEESGLSF